MIRFNLIGAGFLDFEEKGGLSFKKSNPHFRFCDVEVGRSVEFNVPATDRNRALLGFGEDPAENGDILRVRHDCQMVYDGGMVRGTLAVTANQNKAFKCVFYEGDAEWLQNLVDKPLAECPTSFIKGVPWDNTTPTPAENADPTAGVMILDYLNGAAGLLNWQLMPSVNVRMFAEDTLALLGVNYDLSALSYNYWMVAASLSGGESDDVTFTQLSNSNIGVNQVQPYFDIVDITLRTATANVFGILVGGSSYPAKGFKATQNLKATFPASTPLGVWLIKWDNNINRCEVIAGQGVNGNLYGYGAGRPPALRGATVEMNANCIYFFASHPLYYGGTSYGWSQILAPFAITATVERNDALHIGEIWQLRCNKPDMTLFEFLKSVALATGLELTVDAENKHIGMVRGSYGQDGDFVAVDRATEIQEVRRNVDAWGGSTSLARVKFDSEDYVVGRLFADFDIDNENLEETKEWTSKFNEGEVEKKGEVVIMDMDGTSSPPKLAAKKWTIALAGIAGEQYLRRIEAPNPAVYDDIALNSTCVRLRTLMEEADYFAIAPSTTFVWRGMAYVWTNAEWSQGVASLTLQKVSQQVAEAEPTPPEPSLTKNIVVTKVWDDANDYDGIRPGFVFAALLADGTVVGVAILTASDSWTHTFEDMPVQNNGVDIHYSVQEASIPSGYSASYAGNVQGDSFEITNTHVPSKNIVVSKIWDDKDDQDGIRPSSVGIVLKADGVTVGTAILTAPSWSHTFANMPKLNNGVLVTYAVEEPTVPAGYTASVAETSGGFAATNFHEPKATKTCPKCSEEISIDATTCPYCGYYPV